MATWALITNIRGPQGVSVTDAEIDGMGALRVSLFDAATGVTTVVDAGTARGAQGLPGVNAVPADTAVAAYIANTSSLTRAAITELLTGVSPMAYGAVGNGVADDTGAVQAAINAAGTRPVLIDRTYRITARLNIVADGQTIQGAGGRIIAPIVATPAGIGAGLDVFRTLYARTLFANVNVTGGRRVFQFGQEATWPARVPSGHFGSVVGGVVESACEVVRTWYSDGVTVSGLVATDIREYGVCFWGGPDPGNTSYTYPGPVTEITSGAVTGCVFTGKWGDGDAAWAVPSSGPLHPTAGIWTAGVENVIVSGNTVMDFTDVGIDFESSRACAATGNTIHNIAGGGLAVFYACDDIVFSGNVVTRDRAVGSNRLGAGVWIAWRDDYMIEGLTVSANRFTGCGVVCETEPSVDAQTHERLVVSGNTLDDASIIIRMADRAVVTGNTVHAGQLKVTGGVENTIAGNTIVAGGSSAAPLWVEAASSTQRGLQTVVRDNTVRNSTSTAGASVEVTVAFGAMKCLVLNNATSDGVYLSTADATTVQSGNVLLPA